MNSFVTKWFRHLDWTVIATLLLLAIYSCVILFSETYGKTSSDIPATHIVLKQIMFEMLGCMTMFATARFDYRELRKHSLWIYGISTILLVIVLAMRKRFGAHSWIPLGPFAFQPSELAKLAMIIAIGTYMAKADESPFASYGGKNAMVVFAIFAAPFVLTLIEPALGQALVMFAIALLMYLGFAKRSHFIVILAALFFAVFGLTFVTFNFPEQTTAFIQNVLIKHHILQAYQSNRIMVWLNPDYHPNGAGYNVHQAQVAVGSGQIFGEGLLHGVETRGNWIPNQWNDFIFTAIAEQLGFVGSAILITAFLVLLYRLTKIAAFAADAFGTYFILGIIAMVGFQVFENIGADMYLSPSTGIVLPFISYGGTALITNYITIGLALAVHRRSKTMRFTSLPMSHSNFM